MADQEMDKIERGRTAAMPIRRTPPTGSRPSSGPIFAATSPTRRPHRRRKRRRAGGVQPDATKLQPGVHDAHELGNRPNGDPGGTARQRTAASGGRAHRRAPDRKPTADHAEITDPKAAKKAALARHREETEQSIGARKHRRAAAESATADHAEITDSKAAKKAALAQFRTETEQSIAQAQERGYGNSR